MSDMNSAATPAAIVFAALLAIILVSASRTTYTLAPAAPIREPTALAACAAPPTIAREAAERRACSWPQPGSRRARHWPPDAAVDFAEPGGGDAVTAHAQPAGE